MIEPFHFTVAAVSSGVFEIAWNYLQKGGFFMVPLGLTSIAGMTAILYKLLSLSAKRVIPSALAKRIEEVETDARASQLESLRKNLDQDPSPLARLALVAFKHQGRNQRDIVMAVESAARQEIAHLHAGIGVLDVAITISPLLGLIGTASGLVTIFQGLSDNADHLTIARGIAEALTTTIFGISIAVPCVIAHGFFNRKIEMITVRLESLLAGLAYACSQSDSHP